MNALVRYMFTVILLSQRYLAPVLLFVGLMAVLTSSDSGPLAATYGSATGAMLVCSVWLTLALIGLDDQPHRSIVVVNAGSSLRVLLGSVGTALLWCLLLAVAGLLLPLMFGSHTLAPADLVLGTEAQLTCAFTGIAIGLGVLTPGLPAAGLRAGARPGAAGRDTGQGRLPGRHPALRPAERVGLGRPPRAGPLVGEHPSRRARSGIAQVS
ncbi:hypothetical protein [Streptomyces sp. NBC_01373]|uniref:hypothetical protein n=1 Tax=Streptomyces sp. NBC_01373 TaxID=2903843 RepID=UPI0022598EBA|nr:hypothetical protein [Streptomyces sp. NBC_01373]MCX4703079.1 hypothetical protein [Streptomyces sp. NBC_01373]